MASCPPSFAPMAHGEPGSLGPGGEGVVRPLAERPADRVDRREVDHVETHRGRRLEPLVRAVEGAGLPRLGLLVVLGPLGPGEELVPGGEQRGACGRRRSGSPGWGRSAPAVRTLAMAARTSSASTTSSRSSTCWPESRLLAAPRSRAAVCWVLGGLARSAAALNSALPSVQTSETSMPAGILISALCTQVSHGSLQPSTRKRPRPLGVQGDRRRPPVEAERGRRVHRHQLSPGRPGRSGRPTRSPRRGPRGRPGPGSGSTRRQRPWPGRRRPRPPATPIPPGSGRSARRARGGVMTTCEGSCAVAGAVSAVEWLGGTGRAGRSRVVAARGRDS